MLRSLVILTATGRASSAGDSIHTANEDYAAIVLELFLWLWISSIMMIGITLIAIDLKSIRFHLSPGSGFVNCLYRHHILNL